MLVNVGNWSTPSRVKGWSHVCVGSEGALPTGKLCALLGLNCAEIVASTTTMIDEITLSKGLLKVLASFGLETTSWSTARMLCLPVASAGAFGQLACAWGY